MLVEQGNENWAFSFVCMALCVMEMTATTLDRGDPDS